MARPKKNAVPVSETVAVGAVKAAEVKEDSAKIEQPAAKTAKTASKTTKTTKAPASKKPIEVKPLDFEEIVSKFRSSVAKAKAPADLRIAAQVRLSGSVDGILYVLVANGYAVVEGFDYRDADIDIDADADAFYAVISKKTDIATALVNGSVKMQGNAGKAIVLAKVVF